MSRHRFSIVIPTRNRPETLSATLRTCLSQSFEDYEVIVSDNYSEPSTRQVVESFRSPRVRYVRTDAPLAMNANWEFALSHATGEFLMYLGDDDGLLSHALREADATIRGMDVELLTAQRVWYMWPGTSNPGLAENTLLVPTVGPTRIREGSRLLLDILNLLSNMLQLPSIYNSFVRREALERIRGKNGLVFNSSIPDWYTGFALVASIERFGESGVPFRVDGVSAKSTGHAFALGTTNRMQEEYDRLNSTNGVPWSSKVPRVPMSGAAMAAECLQQLRDHVFPDDTRLSVDPRELVRAIIRDLQTNRHPIAQLSWKAQLEELQRYVAHAGESAWFSATYGTVDVDTPPPWTPPKRPSYGLYPHRLAIDAAEFGVADVAEVAQLVDKIFHRRDFQPEVVEEASTVARWISATKDLMLDLSTPELVRAGRDLRRRFAAAKQRLSSS